MDVTALVKKEQNDLIAFAYSILWSKEDARDVVADTFAKLLCANPENPHAWLYQVVKNACWDLIRQRRVRERYEKRQVADHYDLRSPELILSDVQELARLWMEVERLPRKCKLALIGVHLEGRSYAEIAKQLGSKVHSVRRLVERAKHTLHEQIPFRAGPKRAVYGFKSKLEG